MDQIRQYFNAEKSESILFILIGLVAIVFAIYFLTVVKTSFYKGASIPLILVGLIQISVGLSIFIRSPKDISRVEKYLIEEKAKIQSEEYPRMQAVIKNFVVLRYIEIFLIAVGLVLMFAFQGDLLKGIGLTLFIQASITLSLDFFAERRALEYLKFLDSVI